MAFSPTAVAATAIRQALPVDLTNDVRVGSKVPTPRPPRHVRVSRVGGEDMRGVSDVARFLIECWADTEFAAEILANRIHDLIKTLTHQWITTVDENNNPIEVYIRYGKPLSRPVEFPDESPQSRFQFRAEISMKTLTR